MTKRFPKYVLMNGELIEYRQATVHILSTAMKYGAIVFEGLRAYWNDEQRQLYIFRMADHFRRLNASMRIARVPGPSDVDTHCQRLVELIRANELREDLHIRVQVFVDADDGGMGSTEPISVTMAAMPMGRMFQKEGLHVQVSSWSRMSERSLPPRAKAVPNYQNSRLALIQAKLDGYDDAIILNESAQITEGPGYNVFVLRDGALLTPPVTDGILEGVTRDTLIRLAREHGLAVVERSIDRSELYIADEVFFCGSGAEVTPILSVDRHQVGGGVPGRVSRDLSAAYRDVASGRSPDPHGWVSTVYASQGVAR